MSYMCSRLSGLAGLIWRIMPDWQQEHLVALGEQDRLEERSHKYQKITAALLISSTFNPMYRIFPGRPVGLTPGLFVAYHFCRLVDDIADGEHQLPEGYSDFRSMSEELKDSMAKSRYPDSNLGILLRGVVRDGMLLHGVDLKEDIGLFLDAMACDSERRIGKTISTKKAILEIYANSFGVPQDIAFLYSGSRTRSVDVPELAELQGRIYAIQDLEIELSRGIVFIPQEAIPASTAIDYFMKSPADIPEIRDWIHEELLDGVSLAARLRSRNMDWRARKIVGFLVDEIEHYMQNELKRL